MSRLVGSRSFIGVGLVATLLGVSAGITLVGCGLANGMAACGARCSSSPLLQESANQHPPAIHRDHITSCPDITRSG
ncbi:MAG: hypothetical protein ABI895_25870 [Deltaproteobacteria bacterium]